MKLKSKILIFGVAFVVIFPWLNKAFTFIPNPNLENRTFAKFPKFDANNMDAFPVSMDSFLSDNFSLRATSMKVYGRLNLYAFKKSPIPDIVYFGKDGWMFFTGNELKTFDGRAKMTPEHTDSAINKMRYRLDYFKERNIDYYMFIIPVKNVLYGDKQTDAMYALKKKNRTDFFMENMKKALPELKLYYLKDDLLNARQLENETPLYWKTDNHWNRLGAYYGAKSILERLKTDGHHVQLPNQKELKKDSVFGFYGNLSYFTGLKGVAKEWDYFMSYPEDFKAKQIEKFDCEIPRFAHSWEYQMRFQNPDTSLAKILYIRDSFGSDMAPVLAEGSGESLYIFDNWEYGLNKNWVEKFKPKVVVHIMLERYLENLVKKTPYPEG